MNMLCMGFLHFYISLCSFKLTEETLKCTRTKLFKHYVYLVFIFSSPEPRAQVSFLIEMFPLFVVVVGIVVVVNIHNSFSRTTGPISTKFSTPFSNRRYKNEIYSENTLSIFQKSSFPKPRVNFHQTWHRESLCKGDSSFYK